MKKILGLDLGTSSVGWALVNEAENDNEKSSIIKLGVRINPLTVDEVQNFNKQKGETLNAVRTQKRSMRRNLQRYKLRRENLINLLLEKGWITKDTILSEQGNFSTFETYRLRAKAVNEKVTLEEFARILLMINKKRGYKSSRKVKSDETGTIIDGMDVAKILYDEQITPGQFCFRLLNQGKRKMPDFYRSDLQAELDRVWEVQRDFYPELLTDEVKDEIRGKNKSQTWAILKKNWTWTVTVNGEVKECQLLGVKRVGKKDEIKQQNYSWRSRALTEKFGLEELAIVLQEINGEITSSSGYLGAISDRSKELVFNHLTVGQYLMQSLEKNPNASLRNVVFYRQDYLDEFETLWTKQAEFHPELTDELKHEIRDIVIFYQRRLRSQKGLIGICELEQREITVSKNGKDRTVVVGSKQIPKSSPLFQEFRIWQTLNNVKLSSKDETRALTLDEMSIIAAELAVKDKLSKKEVLKYLSKNDKVYDLNFKEIKGNDTRYTLLKALSQVIELTGHTAIDFNFSAAEIERKLETIFEALEWNNEILHFDISKRPDTQAYYRLWHLLYSYESDNSISGNDSLIKRIAEISGMDEEYAKILAPIQFEKDYGNLSAKAIKNILPHLQKGMTYDKACEEAGYRHSKSSLTKEEIEAKELKERLELLPKNSLRNPVVEKVLNQMVNVVNAIIDTYGRPDEIRVELARELKKSAQERSEMTDNIAKATKEQEKFREIIQQEFGIQHPTRTDILRYRLYEELKNNGYHTLYSNTYVRKEEIFSNKFDIEHIIPRARLFDDSFSNKTLELKSINIEKGNKTAYDYVLEKYGEAGLQEYINRCENLFPSRSPKLRKLKMREKDIPEGFVERDLRNTQYISRKALEMLGEVSRTVVATTGSITDRLREDWQLIDIMKELNWGKYKTAGEVEYYENRDGKRIGQIKNWTKRNDHRHHAVDALTVAFTKQVLVQYFNNMNASFGENSNARAIKAKYVENRRVLPPMPLDELRASAKHQLESLLISLQTKNKVVTRNINRTKSNKNGKNVRVQLTPRGQLHEETIYGSHFEYVVVEEKVNASFTVEKIKTVCKKAEREALLSRLAEFNGDSKKAFTGKNTLEKNPLWINQERGIAVPIKVRTVSMQRVFTVRKPINENLPVDKVVDVHVRKILQARIAEYGGNAKLAFSNLDENPIWLNKQKGIALKTVTIKSKATSCIPVRDKHDKEGKVIVDEQGMPIASDFIATGNNHHAAIYRVPKLDKTGNQVVDEGGKLKYEFEEVIVSFYEAVTRVNQGEPAINRNYRADEGWQLILTLKQNEYVVFPNEETGFNPKEIDLMNPDNYSLISPNLYRVQKFSSKYYVFRHHLETKIDDVMALKGSTWQRVCALSDLAKLVKVRVNHLGQIVGVGEY